MIDPAAAASSPFCDIAFGDEASAVGVPLPPDLSVT